MQNSRIGNATAGPETVTDPRKTQHDTLDSELCYVMTTLVSGLSSWCTGCSTLHPLPASWSGPSLRFCKQSGKSSLTHTIYINVPSYFIVNK